MDVFSDVVATMRVGRAKFTRSRRTGAWGNRYGPYPGAGFHVVLDGSCWLITAGETPVLLHAGDVVFLPHGSLHGLSDRPDRRIADLPPAPPAGSDAHCIDPATVHAHLLCGAYRLEQGLAHPFLRSLPDVVHIAATSRHHDLRTAVDLLGADLTDPRPGAEAALPALLDLLLVYLLRAWLAEETAQRADSGWPAALTDPLLGKALHHMHRDPARAWTVQDLATTVGMSRTAFARRFTGLVGQPPLTYLTWWRLSTGAGLLRETDLPLAGIARQVGYSSEFAFSNAFRREFGIAPGRFRRDRRAPADHGVG